MNGFDDRNRVPWEDWRPSPAYRRAGKVFLALVVVFFAFCMVEGVRGFGEARRRSRMKRTLSNIRNIAMVLEAETPPLSGFPCIKAGGELPRAVTAKLPPEKLRDAWGRPIIIISGTRGYVLMSYGSDGRPDAHYDGERFESGSETSDVIWSNGEFLRYPEGICTAGTPPPVAYAIAEASRCEAGPMIEPLRGNP